jgi:hypothetical protein
MKARNAVVVVLIVMLSLMMGENAVFGGQNNFQIAPPPIAYPYFEAGRSDEKIEPLFIDIESQQAGISLAGIGLNFDGRTAFSDSVAGDIQFGFFALNGEMPGVPPITMIPAYSGGTFVGYWTPTPTGKAKVNMSSLQMSLNLELQPIHTSGGSLILFLGPNIGLMSMTLRTPYSLTYGSTTNSGYTDKLQITSTTMGVQFGAQASLSLGDSVKLSPFFMMSSSSGSATLTDDPGVSGTSGSTMSSDIPATTTTSMGMDIIIGDLSLGTILEDLKSDKNQGSNQDVKITIFRMGYHW